MLLTLTNNNFIDLNFKKKLLTSWLRSVSENFPDILNISRTISLVLKSNFENLLCIHKQIFSRKVTQLVVKHH